MVLGVQLMYLMLLTVTDEVSSPSSCPYHLLRAVCAEGEVVVPTSDASWKEKEATWIIVVIVVVVEAGWQFVQKLH